MTASSGFWKRKQPAAVFKHRLMTNYVQPWATMVTRYGGHEAVFVDGYAGPGRYSGTDGQQGEPGSPLIASAISRKVGQMNGPPRRLLCEFVERNPSAAMALESHLASEYPFQPWRVHQADLAERIDDVMHRIDGRPSLIFLDPFGTALPMGVLAERVMAQPQNAPEVLLNFTIEGVWRIGGLLRQDPDHAALNRADLFLGGPWWRETFADARSAAERSGAPAPAAAAARDVSARYRELVEQRTGYRSISVPVRRSPGSPPFFELTLFHRHPAARMIFSDAAAKANLAWRQTVFDRKAERANAESQGQGALFDVVTPEMFEVEEADRVRAVRGRITSRLTELLHERVELSVSNDLELIYGEDLGSATEADLRAAWRTAAEAGVASAPPRGKLRTEYISRSEPQ